MAGIEGFVFSQSKRSGILLGAYVFGTMTLPKHSPTVPSFQTETRHTSPPFVASASFLIAGSSSNAHHGVETIHPAMRNLTEMLLADVYMIPEPTVWDAFMTPMTTMLSTDASAIVAEVW